GGNMMLYESDDDIVVVDCGINFPRSDELGVDQVIPDASYLRQPQKRAKLRAYVITHGHEDHLGALPRIWPELPAPVYATRFTQELLKQKMSAALSGQLRALEDGVAVQIGGFSILPIPVCHSIPGAVALALHTSVGTVVHTGDFKFEDNPLDGRRTDEETLRRLGDQGVTALFSDSTNSEKIGHTGSERQVAATLHEWISSASQRVLVTTFASNVHRLQSIIDVAARCDRQVIITGRSVEQFIALACHSGAMTYPAGIVVDSEHFASLPPNKVLVIASGCQGEPRSGLGRIARGRHRDVALGEGDRVVWSARRIPGNERAIGALYDQFLRQGVELIDERVAQVHTSGHAYNDEQRRMIELCRPKFFIPVHGEYRHMV
ncbi:MAG: ribonuclease J, partial [Caldilineaceae bacterium]|nr:ribonuclease J [Caldilineaceae bacterium]